MKTPDIGGGDRKALVTGPERCGAGQQRRSEQVDVGPADAATGERMSFDEAHRLVVPGDRRHRQRAQLREKAGALAQVTASQFADDERVAQDLSPAEQPRKLGVGPP